MSTPGKHVAPDNVGMARSTRTIHMVGIGGIGMCGIAEILVNLGYQVRGSDIKDGESTARLRQLGCDVRIRHDAEHVHGADVVVRSTAVGETNVEVAEARRLSIPVIRRAEMLAELMRLKYGIAIAGTHGKTTVTSLVAHVLTRTHLDPTVIVGGKVNRTGSTAQLGKGPYLVAEADESDGSFLHLSPTVAVVTNIDPEHLDHYQGGMDEIRATFADFVNRIPFYGLAVLCTDHPEVQAMLPGVQRRRLTYGTNPQADFRAADVRFDGPSTEFSLEVNQKPVAQVRLSMLGEHNVANALASIAVAAELGVDPKDAAAALSDFDGIERRFSVRGLAHDVMVVDDYGHHPAEIRTTLDGARRAYPDRRLVVLFQPHRFSRTKALADDFMGAFNQADVVAISPIFAAGEEPIEGVSQDMLAQGLRRHGHRDVRVADSVDALIEQAVDEAKPGDLVLAFGAGSIGRAGKEILKRLQAKKLIAADGPQSK